MRTELAATLFVLIGFCAASLPFFFSRWGLLFARPATKPFLMYVAESLTLFGVVVAAFVGWESRTGQRAPQDWEYYVVILCLWLVAAFPGFVWRFLLQKRHSAAANEPDDDAA